MRLFISFYCLFQFVTAYAADINLGISQVSKYNQIILTVENRSLQPVTIKQLELILNKKIYQSNSADVVLGGQKKRYGFYVQLPDIEGSYAQQINLYYINDSKIFTLTDIDFFYYKEAFNLPTTDTLYSSTTRAGVLNLKSSNPKKWNIVLPREVTTKPLESKSNEIRQFQIHGDYSGFKNNYPVFAISEGVVNNRHYAQILKTTLQVKHGENSVYRGWTPNSVLLLIVILSLSAFIFSLSRLITNSRYVNSVLAYSSRLFWLSLSYYLLKNSPFFMAGTAAYIEQLSWLSSLGIYWANSLYGLSEYLTGKNYAYFFRYFIDAYFWFFVFLYPVYLHYFVPRNPDSDKYVSCLHWSIRPLLLLFRKLNLFTRTDWSLPLEKIQAPEGQVTERLPTDRQFAQLQSPVKKGFLILAVKLFFLPLLASWVIGNVIHQWNLLQSFEWTFHQANAFILALLILTDTGIFLMGYMFESYRAGNQIRSVEPTLLGWVVCLWCYPPFNDFSFSIFDYQLFFIHVSIGDWAEPVVLSSITLLWGTFVWASFTLGLKASNLTNRGTVSKGPYRFCRHPAYTAKIMIWTIEAIFLGKYFIGLLAGFTLIYFLRAWTEERHLSLDEDYRKYKQQVPFRFIPGVI